MQSKPEFWVSIFLTYSVGSTIVMTGPTDIISDGVKTFLLRNGDPIQTMVTGVSRPTLMNILV